MLNSRELLIGFKNNKENYFFRTNSFVLFTLFSEIKYRYYVYSLMVSRIYDVIKITLSVHQAHEAESFAKLADGDINYFCESLSILNARGLHCRETLEPSNIKD